jgi:RecA-family ATPase
LNSHHINGHSLAPSPLLAGMRSGSWLDEQRFSPLQWMVPSLFPEGFSMLVGAPKIGKSWLTLSIALAKAAGGYIFGHIKVGRPQPVLLLALEDSDRRLQDRIRKLMPEAPIPPLLSYMTRVNPDEVLATIWAWLQTVPATAKPLIILDTLGKVMPVALRGETQYQRDYKVSGALKAICDSRPGTGVIGVHHDRKSSAEDFVETVSGTHGLAGAADTIVVIKRPRNQTEGVLKVTGRDVEEAEYAMQIRGGTTWDLVGNDLIIAAERAETVLATENLSDKSAEMVRFVSEHPEGVDAHQVAEVVGMPVTDVRVYLSRFVSAERITRLERGIYGPAGARAHTRVRV